MRQELLERIHKAKKCGVPFVVLTTPDPTQAATQIGRHINETPIQMGDNVYPLVSVNWDIVRGFNGQPVMKQNEESQDSGVRGRQWVDALKAMSQQSDDKFAQAISSAQRQKNPGEGNLCSALELLFHNPPPENSIIFIHQAHRWLNTNDTDNKATIQAWANLRNFFKASMRMLVLLAPQFDVPLELKPDTVIFDDPLPQPKEICKLFVVHEVLRQAVPDTKDQNRAAAFASGSSWFGAEQAMYLSLKRDDKDKIYMDFDELRSLRHRQIEATKGLKIIGGDSSFKDVYGQDYIKKILTRIMNGNRPPNGVLNVEEINWALAGASGDNTGVSQDQVQVLLDHMEKHGDSGMIFFGVPGCSKSWIAECMSGEFGIDTLQLDLNGMKQGEVGSSENNIREALKVADAVCGGRKLWIATCNSMEGLNEALLRRFTRGVYFFDLPTDDEKQGVWKVQLRRYERVISDLLGNKGAAAWKKMSKGWEKIVTDMWSAADIRNTCEAAFSDNIPVAEAAKDTNPVARQDPHMVPRYHRQAHRRYKSAHTGELFVAPQAKNQETAYSDEEVRSFAI